MSVRIEIKSRPGTFFTVDDEVAEIVNGYSWYLENTGYVRADMKGRKPRKRILLHHLVIFIMTGEWPKFPEKEVDHINHNKFDNCMSNLVVKTKSGNQRNKSKQKGALSEFYGVCRNNVYQKWYAMATVKIEGKTYKVKSSTTDDEILASVCSDCIRDLVGGFLPRNYPDRPFLSKWREIGEKQRRQIFHSMERNNIPIHDNTIFIAKKAA
jgi:hypothetical protein